MQARCRYEAGTSLAGAGDRRLRLLPVSCLTEGGMEAALRHVISYDQNAGGALVHLYAVVNKRLTPLMGQGTGILRCQA